MKKCLSSRCSNSFSPSKNGLKKFCSESCANHEEYKIHMLDYVWRLNKLRAMAKSRANLKSLPFDLTTKHLVSLWEENQGCCALTGLPFDLTSWGTKGQVNPDAPSLDRIIPSKGYVKDNVRIITYHLNISLSDFGIEQFEKLINAYQKVC